MFGPQVSIIFLPTYECNAQCSYCFETKRPGRMSLEDLSLIFTRISTYLAGCGVKNVEVYWQGGEVTVLSPGWCVRAGELISRVMAEHDLDVVHYLQTNLMNYTSQWHEVIFQLFGGFVGSSLDYPNVYRRYEISAAIDITNSGKGITSRRRPKVSRYRSSRFPTTKA